MKLRASLAAAGAAVILGTTGAFVVQAMATLKVVSNVNKTIGFKTVLFQAGLDVKAAGKAIGVDTLHFVFTGKNSANVDIAGNFRNGILYGTGVINKGQFTTGRVTGGTGAFAGTHGTIKTKPAGKGRTAVTIVYSH